MERIIEGVLLCAANPNRCLEIPQDFVDALPPAECVKDLRMASSRRATEAREQNRGGSIWEESMRKESTSWKRSSQ